MQERSAGSGSDSSRRVLGAEIGSRVFLAQIGAEVDSNLEVPGGGKARQNRNLGAGP